MRQGKWDAWHILFHELTQAPFVTTIYYRPKQTDRNGFDPRRRRPSDNCNHGFLIESPHDLASRANTLWYLVRQFARYVRFWVGMAKVERPNPSPLTPQEDVRMSSGKEHGGTRRFAVDHCVCGPSGTVYKLARSGKQLPSGHAEILRPYIHPFYN